MIWNPILPLELYLCECKRYRFSQNTVLRDSGWNRAFWRNHGELHLGKIKQRDQYCPDIHGTVPMWNIWNNDFQGPVHRSVITYTTLSTTEGHQSHNPVFLRLLRHSNVSQDTKNVSVPSSVTANYNHGLTETADNSRKSLWMLLSTYNHHHSLTCSETTASP